jgi:glycine cleavage system H protein
MSQIPSHLRYTESHEWVSIEDNGNARIGISDHAQEALGDLVFVELPVVGDEIFQGDPCAVVESVKAASDIYAPVSGVVVAINEDLDIDPALINADPYGDGWLFEIELNDNEELDGLKDAETYEESLEES